MKICMEFLLGTYIGIFMTMTSLWRHLYLERSQPVQYFAQQFSFAIFLQLASVEQHGELNEESEQVQQANVFKRQTLVFYFSTYRPNSFEHLSRQTPVRMHEGIDRCDRCIGCRNNMATRFFLINNTFSIMSKLFTPNMYCWSCKILVTIYWTHLRRIGICANAAKCFCPQQTNNRRLFLDGWFQRNVAISNVYKWRHSDVIVIKLIAPIQN